jgi:signal transduction histidine kinase
MIETLVNERADELHARNINVVTGISCESISADPAGLSQALSNLLDNAIKFTRDVSAPRIELGARETQNTCILWVRDNGIGFDMQYHARIFEIFQRLHRVEDYPGTGVGLAIVRKAVQRMGGRVWAESAPGLGATFYMEVPK